jgi:hypothetical protein
VARHLEHGDPDVRAIARGLLVREAGARRDDSAAVAGLVALLAPLCCRLRALDPAAADDCCRALGECLLAHAGFAEKRDED